MNDETVCFYNLLNYFRNTTIFEKKKEKKKSHENVNIELLQYTFV